MLESFFFVVSWFSFFIGLLILYLKKEKDLNLLATMPVICITVLGVQSIGAMSCKIAGVDVSIMSTSVILCLCAVGVWSFLFTQGKIKIQIIFSIRDVILLLIPILLVFLEAYHMFSSELNLVYLNDDAYAFFNNAVWVTRSKNVSGMYFDAYIGAMFIQFFSPWLSEVEWYKAFILSDIFMHVLEAWMFYGLYKKVCKRKEMDFLFPVIGVLYFLGYPTFSFMRGNFVYWSTGAVLLMYMIYILIGLSEKHVFRKYDIVMLAIGLFANMICNKLYIVINTVIVIVLFLYILMRRKRSSINKKIIVALVILSVGFVIFYVYFKTFWNSSFAGILELLKAYGYNYRALYQDFLLFIPIYLYALSNVFSNKQFIILKKAWEMITIICLLLYFLNCKEMISVYYYYKMYYILWMISWMLAASVIDQLFAQKKQFVVGIYGMILLCFGKDFFVNKEEENVDNWMLTATQEKNFFNLYANNLQYFSLDYKDENLINSGRYITQSKLEACEYILNYLKEDMMIFYTDAGNYMEGRWISAITGQYEVVLYEDYGTYVASYASIGYQKAAFDKNSTVYEELRSLYSKEDVLYENDDIVVLDLYFLIQYL